MKQIRIGDLDRSMREELFNLHACYVNPDATEKDFYSRLVPIRNIDLRAIPKTELYSLSDYQVANYTQTLIDPSTKFPAISGDCLIDGMHRITTAITNGKTRIEVVDLGKLIDPKQSGFQIKVKVFPEQRLSMCL